MHNISPLDGRYARKTADLRPYFSEYGLIRRRVEVEVRWLIAMANNLELYHIRVLTDDETAWLKSLVVNFDKDAAQAVKTVEQTTNHDVKAVEYYLKQKLASTSLADLTEFVHFGCTSDDINNLAYALNIRDGVHNIWLPTAEALLAKLWDMADTLADVPMLARTHGQPATPTTLGKEFAVFAYRLDRALKRVRDVEMLGKFNGAVGAFNAHLVAFPDADWEHIARMFVEGLGLTYNPLTTQIEPHDWLAELAHALMRADTVLLDLCRDMWAYISLGYFGQVVVAGEVGSSTMPHKVNPIDFENAEANIGLANAMLGHLAEKLPVSRLQRDLSDSSAMRNVGVGIGHSLLAFQSAIRGLEKVTVDRVAMNADLANAWVVLAEPIQTVMRKHGVPDSYERLKALTRGKHVTRADIEALVDDLPIPDNDKAALLALKPVTYIGLAAKLARR